MKKLKMISKVLSICLVTVLFARPLFAQGYGEALTFQGINNLIIPSAGARGEGGISIGVRQDIGLMFQNPATLHSISSIQVSVGGLYYSKDTKQVQQYAPVRYYSNLSLLLEGRTAQIPNPDTSLIGFTAQDSVQRPYDNIGPNWSHSKNDNLPVQAFLAVPLSMKGFKLIAGIGAAKYADLDHYYQNNNVLSPGILSQRPLPTFRPTDDNPLEAEWSQSIQSRTGSINGYGFALAGSIEKLNLSLGFSGMLLRGSSDDFEQQVGRGHLTFFSNAFRVDSVYSRITSTGSSDFSGQEFTLSGILGSKNVSIGFSLKPPSTITRSYSMRVATDTTGTPSFSTVRGEDKIKLPWRGTVGFSLTPHENLMLGLEYEFRPYSKVKYVDSQGMETSPWLSASLFKVGAEYMITPWLALRGGLRGNAEVFQPVGDKINKEPVSYTVYSAGVGISFSGLRLNVAYENAVMKYQDVWASEISKNQENRNRVIADLSYEIPRLW